MVESASSFAILLRRRLRRNQLRRTGARCGFLKMNRRKEFKGLGPSSALLWGVDSLWDFASILRRGYGGQVAQLRQKAQGISDGIAI